MQSSVRDERLSYLTEHQKLLSYYRANMKHDIRLLSLYLEAVGEDSNISLLSNQHITTNWIKANLSDSLKRELTPLLGNYSFLISQ